MLVGHSYVFHGVSLPVFCSHFFSELCPFIVALYRHSSLIKYMICRYFHSPLACELTFFIFLVVPFEKPKFKFLIMSIFFFFFFLPFYDSDVFACPKGILLCFPGFFYSSFRVFAFWLWRVICFEFMCVYDTRGGSRFTLFPPWPFQLSQHSCYRDCPFSVE